jgi:hypothetical protein
MGRLLLDYDVLGGQNAQDKLRLASGMNFIQMPRAMNSRMR